MAKSGPIVIIEDDIEDQEIMADVLREIGVPNKLIFFDRGLEAFDYLKRDLDNPFIILSDLNLPGINGLELKEQIDSDPQLREKSIPFIFFSTAAGKPIVTEAYSIVTIQGFFQKGSTIDELKQTLTLIINYWRLCQHPGQ